MKTTIVIAAHGAPPTDYPASRVGWLMLLEHAGAHIGFLKSIHDSLDREVRSWKRTGDNDPYKSGVESLASSIESQMQCRVIIGYNEFCVPTIPDAIDQAVRDGADQVIVATTMTTRGGEHSEIEIRDLVQAAQQRHSSNRIVYAWPLDVSRVAKMFADELARFTND
jgi:sirohydrochlorin cobaltochelatase